MNSRPRSAGAAEGYRTEIRALYDGAQHSAYTFRRYEDVGWRFFRNFSSGYFGGDSDNFTYPRYALDMALFRVYEDGEPLQPEVYFPWDTEGSRPGDPVFVVGNPGSTLRLETFSQLEFRRDVSDTAFLRFLNTRVDALRAYIDGNPDASSSIKNSIFSLLNASKLYNGRVEALNDDYIMARIRQGEQNFKDELTTDSSLAATYGGLFENMASVQEEKREVAPTHQAFLLSSNGTFSSVTLRRAMAARQYLDRTEAGASGEQVEELRASVIASSQPRGLNEAFLEARLADVEHYYGAEDPAVQQILNGRTPALAAQEILDASVLADSASAAEALESGSLTSDDPALQMIAALSDRYQTYQSAWSGLTARQSDLAAEIGRARFAVYGNDVPPDATFSLRLSDGVVQGYTYNGTEAPAYTTYFGLYGHYFAHGEGTEWELPRRWLSPPSSFDRSTPMNMVSTNDITGGNSGSPVLSRDLKGGWTGVRWQH